MSLATWVGKARQLGASDLHLETGMPPVARVRGELRTLGEALPAARVEELLHGVVSPATRSVLAARGSTDLSMAISGVRCRINLYRTSRGTALAVRLLQPTQGGLKTANLHPDLRRLVEASSGLVLVSGPGGCGKSTTVAALVEEINASQVRHILTLESPLEHLFGPGRSFIRQREIPTHSPSFEQAISDAMRENPDILVLSELRTPEAIHLALDAAENGTRVLAILPSPTCAEAVTRICMSFPGPAQDAIRARLADCLAGVVCQRLDYIEAQDLRVPRCEILMASAAARNAIRSGHLSHLTSIIAAGGEDGMWTFERYQRWMEQRQDWVPPPAPAPAPPPAVTPAIEEPRAATRLAVVPAIVTEEEPDDGGIEILLELDQELDIPAFQPHRPSG